MTKVKVQVPRYVTLMVMLVYVVQITIETTGRAKVVQTVKQVVQVRKVAVIVIYPKKMTVLRVLRLVNVKATYANRNVATSKAVVRAQHRVILMEILFLVVLDIIYRRLVAYLVLRDRRPTQVVRAASTLNYKMEIYAVLIPNVKVIHVKQDAVTQMAVPLAHFNVMVMAIRKAVVRTTI